MRVVLILFLFCAAAYAQPRPFQTARLQSTGGAGVASMLVTEAALLNPATLSFFSDGFASYQNTRTSMQKKNPERGDDDRLYPRTNLSEGYFVFDNAGDAKGGLSFQRQRENGFLRERTTATLAGPISDGLSFGVLYRHTQDSRPTWYTRSRHNVAHPVVLGLTWVRSEKLVFGAIWEDPGRALPGESRAVAGAQYNLTDSLILIADAGGDPTADFRDRHLWRAAVQLNFFSDFFVRAGRFQDNTINQEGLAWGLSWIGPRMGVDFGMKKSHQIDDEKGYLYPKERLIDLSLAISVRL